MWGPHEGGNVCWAQYMEVGPSVGCTRGWRGTYMNMGLCIGFTWRCNKLCSVNGGTVWQSVLPWKLIFEGPRKHGVSPWGGVGTLCFLYIQGRSAHQGIIFRVLCLKQDMQFHKFCVLNSHPCKSPFLPLWTYNFHWLRAPSLKCVKMQTYVLLFIVLNTVMLGLGSISAALSGPAFIPPR